MKTRARRRVSTASPARRPVKPSGVSRADALPPEVRKIMKRLNPIYHVHVRDLFA